MYVCERETHVSGNIRPLHLFLIILNCFIIKIIIFHLTFFFRYHLNSIFEEKVKKEKGNNVLKKRLRKIFSFCFYIICS